ncbi:hypothetical protein U1Q18_024884 [Sarracenia purpurea var. burkii]
MGLLAGMGMGPSVGMGQLCICCHGPLQALVVSPTFYWEQVAVILGLLLQFDGSGEGIIWRVCLQKCRCRDLLSILAKYIQLLSRFPNAIVVATRIDCKIVAIRVDCKIVADIAHVLLYYV